MQSVREKCFRNGQIVDASNGLVETLEAVKEDYDAADSGKTGWESDVR